ncbi:MAG: TerB family tellurite resistance protein [Bacteroidota bacterium]
MIAELNTIEDFTLLLLFHMAHVDGSIHPNERDTILERMRNLFPNDPSIDQKAMSIEREYSSLGDMRAEILLKESMLKFNNADAGTKKEIYSALFDIINANGKVNQEETQVLRLFKDWLTE